MYLFSHSDTHALVLCIHAQFYKFSHVGKKELVPIFFKDANYDFATEHFISDTAHYKTCNEQCEVLQENCDIAGC